MSHQFHSFDSPDVMENIRRGTRLERIALFSLEDVLLVIPVLDNQEGLQRTVDSVAESVVIKTLVIDDGSQPPLESPDSPGVSVQVIRLDRNQGIENALNFGLSHAAELGWVKLIARIDAGDLMTPGRLARQVELFNTDRSLVLAGGGARFIEASSGKVLFSFVPPAEHASIERRMYMNCMVVHAAAMYKLAAAQEVGYYPTTYPANEDHEFFWQLLDRGSATNLQSMELDVEVTTTSISVTRRRQQLLSGIRIVGKRFRRSPARSAVGIAKRVVFLVVPVDWLTRVKRWRSGHGTLTK